MRSGQVTSAMTRETQATNANRHPAALAGAISTSWTPYRRRAYVLGIVSGLLAGGVIAPIVTSTLVIALSLAGIPTESRWPEVVWSIVFALTAPAVAATAYTRWQPTKLIDAAQTYIWLSMRAEHNWAEVFGTLPVPRDETTTRRVLASVPLMGATAGERSGLWMSLLDFEEAKAAAEEMPHTTAAERYERASALWLVDFAGGTVLPLDPLQRLVDAIDDPDERLEASVSIALSRARVALSQGEDWQQPLAAARATLGSAPLPLYDKLLWRTTFRQVLIATLLGLAVYWLAINVLAPYFPVER